jgi:hypothetical protein
LERSSTSNEMVTTPTSWKSISSKKLMLTILYLQSTTWIWIPLSCFISSCAMLKMNFHLKKREKKKTTCVRGIGKTWTRFALDLEVLGSPKTACWIPEYLSLGGGSQSGVLMGKSIRSLNDWTMKIQGNLTLCSVSLWIQYSQTIEQHIKDTLVINESYCGLWVGTWHHAESNIASRDHLDCRPGRPKLIIEREARFPFTGRRTTCLSVLDRRHVLSSSWLLPLLFFLPPSSWPHTQHIREAEEGRQWEVQPRKFRRALDMSSEPVFVAALSKLMIRFSSLFPHFFPSSPSSSFSLLLHLRFLGLLFVGKKIIIIVQFRESGCENCSFFKMDEDHERVVDCTTPNFTG